MPTRSRMRQMVKAARRRTSSVAAGGAVAAVVLCAFPGSASAETPKEVATSDQAALVEFYPVAQAMYTCDGAADGHHFEARYYTSSNPAVKTVKNYNGAGSSNCVKTQLSISKPGWLEVNVCVAEGSTLGPCSGYKRLSTP